jgi:hypothetical protein
LLFILFVVLGAILTLWWRWLAMLHVPAAAWGVWVEISGRVCPLTYLENFFRYKAGQAGYQTSFIEHYLLGIIYPLGITADLQLFLAGLVLLVNAILYFWLVFYRTHASG